MEKKTNWFIDIIFVLTVCDANRVQRRKHSVIIPPVILNKQGLIIWTVVLGSFVIYVDVICSNFLVL